MTTPVPNPTPETPAAPKWREVWQVPLLAGAVLMLTAGLVTAYLKAPKPDLSVGIAQAQKQIEDQEYEKALSILNTSVLPAIGKGALTPDQRRLFHILRAECIYLGQKEKNLDRPENYRSIVSEFEEAEHLNAELSPKDMVFMASALISLGEVDRAVRRIQALPDSVRDARTSLVKQAIDLTINAKVPDYPMALDLLTFLTADARLSVEDRAWSLVRQGDVLLGQGYSSEAVSKIVKALPRLDGATPSVLGEIHYALARAYDRENDADGAVRELDRSAALLEPGSALVPALTLLQGEIFHRKPSLGSARDRYMAIISKYPFADEVAAALLGMGEVEAESLHGQDSGNGESADAGLDAAGAIDRSVEFYTKLVDLVRTGVKTAGVTPERIGDSLLARFREQFDGRTPDYRRALQFASLGEQLFGIDKTPPELILALAQANQKMAEEQLAAAAGNGGVLSLADADPATQREAREHLIRAGDYFRNHAARVVQVSSSQYGDSLWAAADSFDRAGDTDAAIGAFQQFATDFPSDVRQPSARFRLGLGYQARGDLDLAAKIYRDLLAGRDKGERAGPVADASYVPLAQTLLADSDDTNDAEAENLLLSVVNGTVGGTRTDAFRDALNTLGQRYYQTARYERAIERFEEFLARATEAASAPGGPPESVVNAVRYRLADSYRLSAAEIGRELSAGAMPEGERREKAKLREQRLTSAGTVFEQSRAAYEALRHRTALEDLYLRNSYFYLGACAFDLKDYSTAIAHYDAARERYSKDPASLVAMVQVVSCYLAMGDIKKAQLANDRAKRFFDSIPDRAWDDPNLPMTKADWKAWLDAREELKHAAAGSAGGNTAE